MKPTKIPPILAGVAGEYYVAAELSRRGFIASISLRNTRGTDILATNKDASRTITIQVKTSQKKRRKWILSEKSEALVSDTHFYVFVNLGEKQERPDFHIVPSIIVAKFVRESHGEWLSTPGRGGKAHVDNAIRNFEDFTGDYLEKWELLGL
jgi:hypothetical protein